MRKNRLTGSVRNALKQLEQGDLRSFNTEMRTGPDYLRGLVTDPIREPDDLERAIICQSVEAYPSFGMICRRSMETQILYPSLSALFRNLSPGRRDLSMAFPIRGMSNLVGLRHSRHQRHATVDRTQV